MSEEMDVRGSEKEIMGRVVAFLTREEVDFLDKLAKDALFSTGHKLTRTDIIRAMVDAARAREVDAQGVHSKCELEQRLLALMRMTLPQTFSSLKKDRKKNEDR